MPRVRVGLLDSWRGLAIAMVLLGHFVPGLGIDALVYGVNAGRVGVELFFALSGYLIGGILFRDNQSLPVFSNISLYLDVFVDRSPNSSGEVPRVD
ncbi:acyltransferase family protein [Niveibacterium sp. 24ML]|uniref:acyltransferase family protein n=1 Tax=Niveibacterium sp. 24ML TaxID=2985512 RepID=UPI003B632C7E